MLFNPWHTVYINFVATTIIIIQFNNAYQVPFAYYNESINPTEVFKEHHSSTNTYFHLVKYDNISTVKFFAKLKLEKQEQFSSTHLHINYGLQITQPNERLNPLKGVSEIECPEIADFQYQRYCNETLFKFGFSNQTSEPGCGPLCHYCDVKSTSLHFDSSQVGSVTLPDLLAYNQHFFTYKVLLPKPNAKHEYMDLSSHRITFCMGEAAPKYPPQTDLGGFQMIKPNLDNEEPSFKIFWRPVPTLLAGTANPMINLHCDDATGLRVYHNNNQTKNEDSIGSKSITVPSISTAPYTCTLRSWHHRFRESKTYSTIKIPHQDQIFNLDPKFKPYVVLVNNTHILKWNHIENMYPSLNQSNLIYTIYWCRAMPKIRGCTWLDGIVTTTTREFDIEIPSGDTQAYSFGLSFRDNNESLFSSIIWAECVSMDSIKDQLEIKIGPDVDVKSIDLAWSMKACDSIIGIITGYEIAYIQLSSIDPCSQPLEKKQLERLHTPETFIVSKNWTFISMKNDLTTEKKLEYLNPSHSYAIRIRYSTKNMQSDWSNYLLAVTAAEVSSMANCKFGSNMIWLYMATTASLLALGILLCLFYRVYSHFSSMWNQCKKARKCMFEQIASLKVDNMTEFDLMYTRDRFTKDTATDSCNQLTDKLMCGTAAQHEATDQNQNVEYIQLPPVTDYISSQELGHREKQDLEEHDDAPTKADIPDYSSDCSSTDSAIMEKLMNGAPLYSLVGVTATSQLLGNQECDRKE